MMASTPPPISDRERAKLQKQLQRLDQEHGQLDAEIKSMESSVRVDVVRLQKLKKRKLAVRDEIRQLQQQILPDIIA